MEIIAKMGLCCPKLRRHVLSKRSRSSKRESRSSMSKEAAAKFHSSPPEAAFALEGPPDNRSKCHSLVVDDGLKSPRSSTFEPPEIGSLLEDVLQSLSYMNGEEDEGPSTHDRREGVPVEEATTVKINEDASVPSVTVIIETPAEETSQEKKNAEEEKAADVKLKPAQLEIEAKFPPTNVHRLSGLGRLI